MPSEWMKSGADIEKTLFSDKHGKVRIFPPNLKVMLKVRGTETESGESTDGKASEQAKIRVVLKKLRTVFDKKQRCRQITFLSLPRVHVKMLLLTGKIRRDRPSPEHLAGSLENRNKEKLKKFSEHPVM